MPIGPSLCFVMSCTSERRGLSVKPIKKACGCASLLVHIQQEFQLSYRSDDEVFVSFPCQLQLCVLASTPDAALMFTRKSTDFSLISFIQSYDPTMSLVIHALLFKDRHCLVSQTSLASLCAAQYVQHEIRRTIKLAVLYVQHELLPLLLSVRREMDRPRSHSH